MEKRYWLHRITGGANAFSFADRLLEEHHLLSIGWCDFSDDNFINQVRKNGIKAIEKAMLDDGWGLPRNRYNLYRFLCEMREGDYVIVPSQGVFSVYGIADDQIYSNESIDKSIYIDWGGNPAFLNSNGYMVDAQNNYIDLGFYRYVVPLALDIPRGEFADADLQKRMKIRQTNADVSDLRISIEEAILNFENNRPINLKEEIVEDTAPKLLEKIHRYTNPDKFEDLVEWYLKSIGADEIEKPSKNESPTEKGDADRVAYFENIKTAIMVQVKKHDANTSTNDWAVQQIKGYSMNHDYGEYHTQMWVISTCDDFNNDAKQEARNSDVRLINGLEFCKMILDAGLSGLDL